MGKLVLRLEEVNNCTFDFCFHCVSSLIKSSYISLPETKPDCQGEMIFRRMDLSLFAKIGNGFVVNIT